MAIMKPTKPTRTNLAAAKSERPKRTKTNEACVSCRKVKTRCEPPSASGQTRCHRCAVLFLPCSLEDTSITLPSRTEHDLVDPSSSENPAPSDRHLLASIDGTLPSSSPFDGTGLTPEELVCNPPNGSDIVHWFSAPMAPMHKLVSGPPRTLAPHPMTASGVGALSNEELRYLSEIFKIHYTPWLNLPEDPPLHIPLSLDDPITLAQCAVASRHLPPDVFGAAQPNIQQKVENDILVHLSDVSRSPSVEAVHALMILSLWCPAVGAVAPSAHTGREISKGAVEMALVLGLDKTADDAFWQREETLEEGRRQELTYKVHLWSAVCSAELMLMLGTSTEPLAARPAGNHRSIDPRALLGGGSTSVSRQLRLRVTAHVHRITLGGLRLRCQDLDSFGAEIQEIMLDLGQVRSEILPLQATSPHEPMHTDVLMLLTYWDSLILILHGFTQVLLFTSETSSQTPWASTLPGYKTTTFVSRIGTKVVTLAQTTIITFLNIHDRCQANMSSLFSDTAHAHASTTFRANFSSPLSTAPDAVYAAVLAAASALLLTRYVVFSQFSKRHALTWVSTGALLSRLADTLDALSITEHHAPRRAAAVARELHRTWNEQVAPYMVPEAGTPHTQPGTQWTVPMMGLDLLPAREGFPHVPMSGSDGKGAPQGPEVVSESFPAMGIDANSQVNLPDEDALLRFFEGIELPMTEVPIFDVGFGGADGGRGGLPDLPDSSIDDDFWSSLMGRVYLA